MKIIKTQAQLDKLTEIKAGEEVTIGAALRLPGILHVYGKLTISKPLDTSWYEDRFVRAWGSATVEASGSATVEAWGSATVRAGDSATVRAWDSATVEAWGSATVRAWDSATVEAWGSATVEAWGSATVRASGSATVRAGDSATVEAGDSATVEAWGSATVRAWGSATVRASGSATVRAGGSATVEAWGSATVEAWGWATVEASGSATVEASGSATVRLLGFAIGILFPSVKFEIKSDFAKVITRDQVFKTKKKTTVYKKLDKGLIATLELPKGAVFQSENNSKCRTASAKVLKIEDKEGTKVDSGKSQNDNSFVYIVGETVSAPYNEAIEECSTGIHFFLDRESAERY